jgi:hypothetical protein
MLDSVASPFLSPSGRDASAPVRAKEWAKGEGRVRVYSGKWHLFELKALTSVLSPCPRGEAIGVPTW